MMAQSPASSVSGLAERRPLTSDNRTVVTDSSLPHIEQNVNGSSTIVMLHGLTGTPTEYTYVTSHLINKQADADVSYHVIIPYLPAHGLSSHITPFSIPGAADLVANLIKTKAKGGKAYLVGLSLGGCLAIYLAKTYSDLVLSLFVTGVGDFIGRQSGSWRSLLAPYVLTPMNTVQHYLPNLIQDHFIKKWGLKLPEGIRQELWKNSKFSTLRAGFDSIHKSGGVKPLPAPCLVVAGGLQDSINTARLAGQTLRKGNEKSVACVVRRAIHAWDLQFPELFAQGVRCWFEDRDLPSGFEILT